MTQQKNPYATRRGFGWRYQNAKRALERYGQDYSKEPYSRGFDNCFEMNDGEAVVWALMHDAIMNKNSTLAEGIRRTYIYAWRDWLEVYEQREKYAPKQEQLNLNLVMPTSKRPTGKRRERPKTPSM